MISDVWWIGDINDKEKLAFLAVMDLKSRYIFLEELGELSSKETATKLIKMEAILNFKDCILRTDPGTNFTGKEVLKLMKAKWKVGVTDNHVEQAHIEWCFRELNSHLRPLLVDLYKKDQSKDNLRMGAYLSMRIYNNSVNLMGFAPAQMFTPSETLDLQILK